MIISEPSAVPVKSRPNEYCVSPVFVILVGVVLTNTKPEPPERDNVKSNSDNKPVPLFSLYTSSSKNTVIEVLSEFTVVGDVKDGDVVSTLTVVPSVVSLASTPSFPVLSA